MKDRELNPNKEDLACKNSSKWVAFRPMKHFFDKIGITLSVLCLIHCLLLPFLILAFPVIQKAELHHASEEIFHKIMLLLIILVAMFTFVPGYMRSKKKILITLPLLAVTNLVLVEFFLHIHDQTAEIFAVSCSSLLLILAHYINIKSCRTCSHHSSTHS